MKVTWNQKTNLPIIEFDDADFSNAAGVNQLLAGEFSCRKCGAKNANNVWKILEGYFSSMRISIEEVGKAHARSRAKKDLCSNDFSILDGFDIAVDMPHKIIRQANMMKELKKNREAQERGTVNDDGE